MAKYENRYIQFYTPGTAAVKVEIQDEQNWAPLPELKPEERKAVYIDPVAIVSCFVAVCMLVLMAVGIGQLNNCRAEVAAMERYVAQLTAEKQALEATYAESYDLAEIEQKALEMGMIPIADIPETQIYITMSIPQIEEPVTLWDRATTFLAGLFA